MHYYFKKAIDWVRLTLKESFKVSNFFSNFFYVPIENGTLYVNCVKEVCIYQLKDGYFITGFNFT